MVSGFNMGASKMSLDAEAKINELHGYFNGFEARIMFLDGGIPKKSNYTCAACNIKMLDINIEKEEHEHFVQTPHFRSKQSEPHFTDCPYFEERDPKSGEIIKKNKHSSDKVPRVLNLPKIDFKTLTVIENLPPPKRSINPRSVDDEENREKTGTIKTQMSQNKIVNFVVHYSDICFKTNDYKIRKNLLIKEKMTIDNTPKDYEYYFKSPQYTKHSFWESEAKIPRIRSTLVKNNYIEHNDRYEIQVKSNSNDDKETWIIILYKKHLLPGNTIQNKMVYLMTYPRSENNTVVYSSICRELVCVFPVWNNK